MIGPMIIQLQEPRGQLVVIAEKDTGMVCVFERQKGGRDLKAIQFPLQLTVEEHDDPTRMAEMFKTILISNGWRERELDEAEQRHMLLTALQDLSVRFMRLEASIMFAGQASLPRPYDKKVQ